MKKLILLLTFIVCAATNRAQSDFDWSIYTIHAQLISIEKNGKVDTLTLMLLRRIEKNTDALRIISLNNTADALTYKLDYAGYDPSTQEFLYYDHIDAGDGVMPQYKVHIFAKPQAGYIIIEHLDTQSKTIFY